MCLVFQSKLTPPYDFEQISVSLLKIVWCNKIRLIWCILNLKDRHTIVDSLYFKVFFYFFKYKTVKNFKSSD